MPISVNIIKIPVEAKIASNKKSLLGIDIKVIDIRLA
jgi:hypothetical protein